MKTVFEPSMVAHVWANQSQTRGKTKHGNFYFEGARLFSYGSHYLCGLIMPDGTALVNASENSKTTNGHRHEAWHAVTHRVRHSVPGLTAIGSTLEQCSGAKTEAGIAARARKYVSENVADISQDAAGYLLSVAGIKNAAKVAAKLLADAKRAEEKQKEQTATATKRARLSYASRVSAMAKNEKSLVAGLADIVSPSCNSSLLSNAKDLHNAHRAAKAAKRENQARDVWRVLGLVRAEIARREKAEAIKNRNAYQRNQIESLRAEISRLKDAFANPNAAPEYTDYHAGRLNGAAVNVLAFPRAKRAVPALEVIAAGAAAVADELESTRAERERVKAERAIPDWRNGVAGARAPYSYNRAAMLRAVNVTRDASGAITGGTLETSQGANVPLPHAVRAFRFIKLVRERGREWRANGHSVRVGHFRVDSIAANGNMVAGCHRIDWEEIERLAVALGIFEIAASDSALEETAHAA